MLNQVIDAAGCSERLQAAVPGSALRDRPACSKKRGGGIAPAAIGALIEAGFYSVNALGAAEPPKLARQWSLNH